MISYAENKDLEQILNLWIKCFPGDDAFREYFFKNIYDKSNTLIYVIDENIVGMLQMLPYCSSFGDVTYIYGVCTSNEFRKQGIAQRLMYKSFEISKERGHQFSILIPANPSLFDFYAKYGYEATLFYDQKIHTTEEKSDSVFQEQIVKEDLSDILEIYKTQTLGDFYILRDENMLKHQIYLYGKGAIKYILRGKIIGYSFGTFEDGCYFSDEIFAEDILMCVNSHDKISYKTYGKSQKLGVIKPLFEQEIPTGYISLMYN